MARLLQLAFILALIATAFAAQSDDSVPKTETAPAQSKIKLFVYHNDDGTYKKRGEITGSPSSLVYTSTLQDDGIDVSGSLYQVKIRDEATDRIILSSVKTCQLVASNWADEFRVHLDDNNQVYHVDYNAQTSACVDGKLPVKTPRNPSTKVTVEQLAYGAKPILGHSAKQPTAQKTTSLPDGTKGAMEELPVEEEKTFFQKYWYLILAGGLILVNNLSPPPENSQQRR